MKHINPRVSGHIYQLDKKNIKNKQKNSHSKKDKWTQEIRLSDE